MHDHVRTPSIANIRVLTGHFCNSHFQCSPPQTLPYLHHYAAQAVILNPIAGLSTSLSQASFCQLVAINPLPTNDTHMRHSISISHKHLYGGFNTRRYTSDMVSASFQLFLMVGKGLNTLQGLQRISVMVYSISMGLNLYGGFNTRRYTLVHGFCLFQLFFIVPEDLYSQHGYTD